MSMRSLQSLKIPHNFNLFTSPARDGCRTQQSCVTLGYITALPLFWRLDHWRMCRLNHRLDGEAAPSSKRSTKANTTSRLLCKSNASAEIIIDVGAAGENETNKKAVYQSIALRH